MSKPVSNTDVEDVLASIRRLVSEERRPFRASVAAQDEDHPATWETGQRSDAGRLVLTPSLRVPAAHLMPGAGDAEEPERSVLLDPSGPLRLDEAARVPGGSVLEETHERNSLAVSSDPEEGLTGPADHASQARISETEADAAPEEQGADPQEAAGLTARAAGSGGRGREPQPDCEAAELPAGDAHMPSELQREGAMRTDPTGPEAPALDLGVVPHPSLVDREAPLVLEPEDRSDLPAGDPASGAQQDVRDDRLEETVLRALVSDIVREELNGELGARITRNVRKLVRREIQRALASRELD